MFYGFLLSCLIFLIAYEFGESSYSSVRMAGSNSTPGETTVNYTPKTFKALTMQPHKLFSKVILDNISNSTSDTIEPTVTKKNLSFKELSTGRALYYSPPDIISNLQMFSKTNNKNSQMSFNRSNTLKKSIIAMPLMDKGIDRFTPGEAVSSDLLKRKKNPTSKTFQMQSRYITPKYIYNFPPNLQSNYPLVAKGAPSDQISSYLPPPAGPIDSETEPPKNQYPGPLSPEYLTPSHLQNETDNMKHENSEESNDHVHEKNKANDSDVFQEHDHDHHTNEYIPTSFDYGNFNYHNFKPDFPWKIYSSHPEIFSDGNHDHDFHHYEKPTTSSPPVPLPPPIEPETNEPSMEPRVKKYSYFYLGRKLWYIPLYFTVWFSFYILWLIIKSIARHKVNLPNHYTGRSFHKRNIFSSFEIERDDFVNELTNFVMKSIDIYK